MKETWKLFESVAYEYVSNLYKNSIKKEHTVESHDSGYDGIWIIPSSGNELYKKIMMEAKYRESQSSLPLNDCAKAIIIAFNSSANKLYIATNIELAPQTKEQISKFNNRSALAIVSVDNSKLKKYIQENKSYLIRVCKTTENHLAELESKITSLSAEEKNYKKRDLREDICLLDVKRKKLMSDIVKTICVSSCKVILSGVEGIGKSVLLDKICNELHYKKFDTQKIDLSLCSTSRILYLKILETVWGVSVEAILKDIDLCTYIDRLIATNGEGINSDVLNAVKHIFAIDICEYEGYSDIYRYYLLSYLNSILQGKNHSFHLAVIFENVNSLSIECLNFLLQIVDVMTRNGLRIILELRQPFVLVENIKDLNYYDKTIKKDAFVYLVESLSEDIIYKLIRKYINLNQDACKQFGEMLQNNPLKIKNALEYIKQISPQIHLAELNQMSNEKREDFWNALGIDANRELVSLILRYRMNSCVSEFFEMVYIMDGEISCSLLSDYWGTQTDEIYEFALNSSLFKIDDNNVCCAHLRILSAIKMTSQFMVRENVARKLKPIITSGSGGARAPYIQLELMYILRQDDSIGNYTMHVMALLEDSQQYKQAIEIAKRYLDREKENSFLSLAEKDDKVHILLRILHCIYELHADNQDEYKDFFQMTEKAIILCFPNHTACKEWYEYSLFLWHKNFIAGIFDKAYQISKELYDKLPEICCFFPVDDDIAGRIYSAYGLSLKMIKGGIAATNLFIEGIEKYPKSYNARAAYLSQEGNRLLKTKPLEAVKKYRDLLVVVKGKDYPFLEVLHTRIDIAMSYFLAQNYDIARIWAEEGLEIASSLSIYAEKGRALNILGCCKAANGEYEDGLNVLAEGDFCLEFACASIYRWRVNLNRASILLQLGREIEAKDIIAQVLNVLLSDFIEKIKSDNLSVPYQSLLLILMYLHEMKGEVKKILSQFEGSSIQSDFFQLCQTAQWKKSFCNKVKYCNGIVLVTG